MERYESRCVACGHRWSWIGYKTAMGKTPAQLAEMKRAGKTCPACGGIAKVGLDHDSPEAKAFDGALRDALKPVLEPAARVETTQLLGGASGGRAHVDAIGWILKPLSSDIAEQPPSPNVPFHVGQTVALAKIGWCGTAPVVEIRGEHVRLEATIVIFDEQRPLWFHYTELRPV